ncbi:Uncharacterised protein [Segatella copri]|nr:Uncharacterised protein [Segatella copri]
MAISARHWHRDKYPHKAYHQNTPSFPHATMHGRNRADPLSVFSLQHFQSQTCRYSVNRDYIF